MCDKKRGKVDEAVYTCASSDIPSYMDSGLDRHYPQAGELYGDRKLFWVESAEDPSRAGWYCKECVEEFGFVSGESLREYIKTLRHG